MHDNKSRVQRRIFSTCMRVFPALTVIIIKENSIYHSFFVVSNLVSGVAVNSKSTANFLFSFIYILVVISHCRRNQGIYCVCGSIPLLCSAPETTFLWQEHGVLAAYCGSTSTGLVHVFPFELTLKVVEQPKAIQSH